MRLVIELGQDTIEGIWLNGTEISDRVHLIMEPPDEPYTYEVALPEMDLTPADHTPKVHMPAKRAEWDAAMGIAPNANTSGWKVLRAYGHAYERGEGGLTSHQVAARLAMNPYTVKPRCTELERAGFLEDTGHKGPGPSGPESCTVYRITHLAALSMELAEPPQGHVIPLPLEESDV